MHWYEMETSITMVSSKSKYWLHTLNLDPTEPRFNLGDLLSKIDCIPQFGDIWIGELGSVRVALQGSRDLRLICQNDNRKPKTALI